MTTIGENYNGYLQPYLAEIVALLAEGKSNIEIARALRQRGARSRNPYIQEFAPWDEQTIAAMIGYLRRSATRPPDITRLQRRVAWAEAELVKAKVALAQALVDGRPR